MALDDFIDTPRQAIGSLLFPKTDGFSEKQRVDSHCSPFQMLQLKLWFGHKAQAAFLEHYLSIRGSTEQAKETEEILELMDTLYSESKARGAGIKQVVAELLAKRIGDGYELHAAMSDIFQPQFTTIVMAMQQDKASEGLANAISTATTDVIRLGVVKRQAIRRSAISLFMIHSVLESFSLGKAHWESVIEEHPGADRFIAIPHMLYNIGEFYTNNVYLGLTLMAAIVLVVLWLQVSYCGEYREELDKYAPPFVIYRYLSGLNIFTGITLMVGTLKMESQDALKTLRDSCNKYERWHIDKMLARLAEGHSGTEQLDTGLLSSDLQLTLRMAGEGEGASIKVALDIINRQGRDSIIKALSQTTFLVMVATIIGGILMAGQVLGASAMLFQATLNM